MEHPSLTDVLTSFRNLAIVNDGCLTPFSNRTPISGRYFTCSGQIIHSVLEENHYLLQIFHPVQEKNTISDRFSTLLRKRTLSLTDVPHCTGRGPLYLTDIPGREQLL
jgi:hypothetical protein